MKNSTRKSINQINNTAIVYAGVFALLSVFIVVFNEYLSFQKEAILLEKSYMQDKKIETIDAVALVGNVIHRRVESSPDIPKEVMYDYIAQDIERVVLKKRKMRDMIIYEYSGKIVYSSLKKDEEMQSIVNSFVSTSTKGGDFVMAKDKTKERMFYLKEYEPLGLMMVCGVDLDEIKNVLATKKEEYRNVTTGFILKFFTLAFLLYVISTIKSRYITDKIKKEIAFIGNSFKKASQDYKFIDYKKSKFNEFSEIIMHANEMIAKIKEKNSDLSNLNAHLEEMVEQKTQALTKSMAFTQELLQRQDIFVKNAIHEINTPLSIIMTNIDLYNLKYDKNPYLVKIEGAVKVLENIYADLEYVVKKDNAKYPKSTLNLSDFVKDRLDYFKDVAHGNGLFVESQIEEDIYVSFNEIELQRICDNTISNAIKYSFEHKSVHVRIYRQVDKVFLEFENEGEPIKFPNRVFDRYYRENDVRGGFGLGLSIVKGICDKEGVLIEVLSMDGKTVFRYCFEFLKDTELSK
ncbi:MAG: HAMP domain-containing sensor histidine kinase [Sulfurospirillaceae bacterium]|nr:HAMP domain-containing sensor histidine kinase [Sulfurospirillaceae bacterium]MDD3463479.1 HAMP domain-containing sensor histidine kinase [Sulfurospirillaceae bacterium]